MKGSKLAEILYSLTPKEWKLFKEYVSSPFFNKNQQVVKLLEVIYKYHSYKSYEKDAFPKKENIWKKLFPRKEYNDQRLFILMSKLDKLSTDFINYQYVQETHITNQVFTLRACLSRSLPKHFKRIYETANKSLINQPLRNTDYYHHKYLLQVEKDFSNHRNAKERDLIGVIHDLDIYYWMTKLRYLCSLLNRKDLLQVTDAEGMKKTLKDIRTFADYISKLDFSDTPVLHIYRLNLMTLLEPENETHFRILKDLLNTYRKKLAKNETQDIYLYLQNYLVKKLNTGKGVYLEELFDLYKDMLNNVLLEKDGGLDLQYFKNIVTTGLRLNKFDWVQNFIEVNHKVLPERDRTNAYYYSMGYLHFYKQDFDQAMKELVQVNSQNLSYNLATKSILLKSYYELDEEEALFSLTHSFTTYIRRNKIMSDTSKQNYRNMIKFIKKLSTLQKKETRKGELLLKLIQETSNVMERQWLIRKTKEKFGF